MAHLIETLDLPHYSRVPAWHGLGIVTSERDLTRPEVCKAVGVNEWAAQQAPGYFPYDPVTGRPIAIGAELPANVAWRATECRYNVRSDLRMDEPNALLSPAGVGNGYELVQYETLVTMADEIMRESGIAYEAAGDSDNGKKGWLLLRTPKTLTVGKTGADGKVDRVQPYLLLSNAHDGSGAFNISPTAIRVVCWNTLSAAWAESARKLKHTANVLDRARDTASALRAAMIGFGKLETTYNSMATAAIDDRFAQAMLLALVPNPRPTKENPTPNVKLAEKRRSEIWTLFSGKQAGASLPSMLLPDGKRTAFALYNALTEHQGYLKGRRAAEGTNRNELRMARNVLGQPDANERKVWMDSIVRNLESQSDDVKRALDTVSV